MLAAGGDCPADVAMLQARPHLFGKVASDPTVSRIIGALASDPAVDLIGHLMGHPPPALGRARELLPFAQRLAREDVEDPELDGNAVAAGADGTVGGGGHAAPARWSMKHSPACHPRSAGFYLPCCRLFCRV